MKRTWFGLLAGFVGVLCFPATAGAVDFPVTKTADTNDDTCDADCSLREAIEDANDNGVGLDTITLPAGAYTLSMGGPGDNDNLIGDLDVAGAVTVNGAGAASTVIAGAAAPQDRVFDVGDVSVVTLNGVTVTAGRSGDGEGGGGIKSDAAALIVNDSIVSGNSTSSGGGGGIIAQDSGGISGGGLVLTRSTVSGNTVPTDYSGGGIFLFNNNIAGSITRSTISGNTGGSGGGINVQADDGDVAITNSTISNNTATNAAIFGGGGLFTAPSSGTGGTTVTFSTIAGNTGPAANGANLRATGGAGELEVESSILGAPIGATNCTGDFLSLGTNLASDSSCLLEDATDLVADPLLGPLANNGGPTMTRLILSGSPAIDRAGACTGTDQRGQPRPFGSGCDSGAVERHPSDTPPLASDPPTKKKKKKCKRKKKGKKSAAAAKKKKCKKKKKKK